MAPLANFPLRNLHRRLNISKSIQRLRRHDADWHELVVEFDLAGVTMADDDDIERFLARKRERGEAAKQQPPVQRKRGRPPKVRITVIPPPARRPATAARTAARQNDGRCTAGNRPDNVVAERNSLEDAAMREDTTIKANVFPVVPAVPAGRYSWGNPDESLLEDRRGDLPEFPHETIPSGLQGWLLLATRGAGVRTDHIAVPMLGVASSLIGKARRIRASSSWLEPMTLWVCVVAASGDRKTPGFQVVLRALDRIEKENTPQYREARLAHQLRAEKAKAELKRWRKACQEALEAKPPGEPAPMPIDAVDPGEFIHPVALRAGLHNPAARQTVQRAATRHAANPR